MGEVFWGAERGRILMGDVPRVIVIRIWMDFSHEAARGGFGATGLRGGASTGLLAGRRGLELMSPPAQRVLQRHSKMMSLPTHFTTFRSGSTLPRHVIRRLGLNKRMSRTEPPMSGHPWRHRFWADGIRDKSCSCSPSQYFHLLTQGMLSTELKIGGLGKELVFTTPALDYEIGRVQRAVCRRQTGLLQRLTLGRDLLRLCWRIRSEHS
ncbi:hypothetical protein Tco_0158681 [Tanacetum coccineum]